MLPGNHTVRAGRITGRRRRGFRRALLGLALAAWASGGGEAAAQGGQRAGQARGPDNPDGIFRGRRRAGQRDRDGHRRPGPFRGRADEGRLPRLRGRRAGGDHPVRQRTGAGQPGHRPRHERQHGRPQDGRGPACARPLPVRPARARRRDLPLPVRLHAGPAAGLDDEPGPAQPGHPRHPAPGRDRAVRRGGRVGAARRGRPPSQEGAADHLGRQRQQQRGRRSRAAGPHPRGPRRWSTRSASTAARRGAGASSGGRFGRRCRERRSPSRAAGGPLSFRATRSGPCRKNG